MDPYPVLYCPRGPGPDSPFRPPFDGQMEWETRPNGDRCCSYCGSLHPDDLLEILLHYAAGIQGYGFSLTDKSYKVYAHRPGVQNASQGGIKFYGHHAVPRDHPQRARHEEAWAVAVQRYSEELATRWGSEP